jgi:alpha-L-rhamnosidase
VYGIPFANPRLPLTDYPFSLIWAADSDDVDRHVLLRGEFNIARECTVLFRHIGASTYRVWLDGEVLDEGPARFDAAFPEFLLASEPLRAGPHLLAVHAHFHGVTSRITSAEIPGFFLVEVRGADAKRIPISWKGIPSPAYQRLGRRLGCVLGPVEWCDTRLLPSRWTDATFPDQDWPSASPVSATLGPLRDAALAKISLRERPVMKISEGPLVNQSPIDHDPPMNFVTREIHASQIPADGIWQRFDLGRVQLGRPRLRVNAPAGALLQCAYAECLTHGRVSPYLKSGSGENSCMMDTWILSGGLQTVEPLQPKGARFLEVHLFEHSGAPVSIEAVEWIERTYYPDASVGKFACNDDLLNRIWHTGVETLCSCAEDAITDNPHRERGQWLGDAVGAGMDVVAVSYSDWRPLERGLRQAAQCAGDDGLIPAVFPGTREYLPSFAIQWVAAMLRYHRLGGDGQLLIDLYEAAVRNIRSFDADREPLGLRTNPKHWNFIDWGYTGCSTVFFEGKLDEAGFDPALSLMYLGALRALAHWATLINEDPTEWSENAKSIASAYSGHIEAQFAADPAYFETLGFHSTALALAQGVVPLAAVPAAIAFLKVHMLACFPNDLSARRLSGTTMESKRVITPFFLHHVLPVLIEHGEMEFVLSQIRTCWGWALDLGLTTWPEVFDTRWSHCHQWSACPTWIISRYVLGLHPRFDVGQHTFELKLHAGDLTFARGTLPLHNSHDTVEISWRRTATDRISFSLRSPLPVVLLLSDGRSVDTAGEWRHDMVLTSSGAAVPAPDNSRDRLPA